MPGSIGLDIPGTACLSHLSGGPSTGAALNPPCSARPGHHGIPLLPGHRLWPCICGVLWRCDCSRKCAAAIRFWAVWITAQRAHLPVAGALCAAPLGRRVHTCHASCSFRISSLCKICSYSGMYADCYSSSHIRGCAPTGLKLSCGFLRQCQQRGQADT